MKSPKRLQLLHVVGSLDSRWGGLSLYVAELAAELAAQGHRVQVLCQSGELNERWPSGNAEVILGAPGSSEWDAAHDAADLVHVHGLWLPFYHQALVSARRRNKPHLLSVHGMLESGALTFSRWKKSMALWVYQRKDLRMAAALHATSESELRTLRAFGLRQPVVALPPGVRLPPIEQRPSQSETVRRLLFLGRIHPKKGILSLVDAWAEVRPEGWKLDLAGPDEANHLAEVRSRLRERKLEDAVVYHGPTFGEAKERLLRAASLMVAPSLSENFGIVVAEGLARSLPVITTTGMPWEILVRERCGWWVPPGVEPLVTVLRQAISLPTEKLEEMGQRGRKLAEREFGWSRIAREMVEAYAWLMGDNVHPGCVRTG